MPRRKITFVPGMILHVTNRGALRMNLFYDDNAYHTFIGLCHRFAEDHGITILALCLMPNHFHLLLRIEEGGDLSEFMKCVSHTFSRRMNRALRRTGTIFEGRFFASHVDSDSYLVAAIRYIHLNPVKAGLASYPTEWEFSDVREALGQRSYIRSSQEYVKALFGGRRRYEADLVDNMSKVMIDHPTLARDLAEAGFL